MPVYMVRHGHHGYVVDLTSDQVDDPFRHHVRKVIESHPKKRKLLNELYTEFTTVNGVAYEVLYYAGAGSSLRNPNFRPTLQLKPRSRLIYVVRVPAVVCVPYHDAQGARSENGYDYTWEGARHVAQHRLHELGRSDIIDSDFILITQRWSIEEPVLLEMQQRGTLLVDYAGPGHNLHTDFVVIACRRAPDEAANMILNRMNGWAAMVAALCSV